MHDACFGAKAQPFRKNLGEHRRNTIDALRLVRVNRCEYGIRRRGNGTEGIHHAFIEGRFNNAARGYDLSDHRIVWSTIEEEVPVLLAEVEALLRRPK